MTEIHVHTKQNNTILCCCARRSKLSSCKRSQRRWCSYICDYTTVYRQWNFLPLQIIRCWKSIPLAIFPDASDSNVEAFAHFYPFQSSNTLALPNAVCIVCFSVTFQSNQQQHYCNNERYCFPSLAYGTRNGRTFAKCVLLSLHWDARERVLYCKFSFAHNLYNTLYVLCVHLSFTSVRVSWCVFAILYVCMCGGTRNMEYNVSFAFILLFSWDSKFPANATVCSSFSQTKPEDWIQRKKK